jgi:NAD+ synthase (glutamine-hydrolysing)
MKIALGQINTTIGDMEGNAEKIKRTIEEASRLNTDLVVFPEMAITSYPPRDLLEKDSFIEENLRTLEEVAGWSQDIGVICGFVDKNNTGTGKKLFNAAAFLYGGRIVSRQYKSLLPTYDVFDEARYFEPGREGCVLDFRGCKVGISICEDIWNDKDFWKRRLYAVDPTEELIRKGAQMLVNVSASPYSVGKLSVRKRMLSEVARKYGCPLVYVNQVGGNDELVFDGASFAVNVKGEVVAQCRDFEEDMVVFDSSVQHGVLSWVSEEEASVLKALVMGTRDYAKKCGFMKVVVGLSGGIDSSLTSVIAVEALGKDNVLGVMMPSVYSSEGSVRDARKLVKNLGIESVLIPITPIFQAYLDSLKTVFGECEPDVTEENLQARIRGNFLMAISNKFGYLVLNTGCKSEMAVGYATLYGDMAGGLAVISDVPKTTVYRLAEYVNREREVIPKEIIEKAPSAELRPNQRDEDSLPPYAILDGILKAYVEDNLSPEAIAGLGYDTALVRQMIRRVDANEYKRRQAVPGLRITSKAFGMGRRLPIAQKYGGV